MSRQLDRWLASRAAEGDQRAFAALLDANARKVRHVALDYATGSEGELDDLEQIVRQRIWVEVQRGSWNARVDFAVFVARVGHQALRDEWQRRRASKRWDPLGPPVSLDMVADPDPENDAPIIRFSSWQLGTDPLQVVLERERLREGWRALTDGQARAINQWLRCDGVGLPSNTLTLVSSGRQRARAKLLTDRMARPLRLV